MSNGAEEGTRTPPPLRVHGPEPCASANSATSASKLLSGAGRLEGRYCGIYSYKASTECQTWTGTLRKRAWPRQIRAREAVKMSDKPAVRAKNESQKSKQDLEKTVVRLRTLAHDLSNSLEAIMQASYLLGQTKLEGESKRWAQLLESSSDEAARTNREIRKLLRSLSSE